MLAAIALVVAIGATDKPVQKIPAELLAFQAAAAKGDQMLLPVSGNNIFIQHKGKFIVVSVVSECSLRLDCRGGRTHYVYDPGRKKVVYVLSED